MKKKFLFVISVSDLEIRNFQQTFYHGKRRLKSKKNIYQTHSLRKHLLRYSINVRVWCILYKTMFLKQEWMTQQVPICLKAYDLYEKAIFEFAICQSAISVHDKLQRQSNSVVQSTYPVVPSMYFKLEKKPSYLKVLQSLKNVLCECQLL